MSQITDKFTAMAAKLRHRWKGFPPQPSGELDFCRLAVSRSPFGPVFHHPAAPLPLFLLTVDFLGLRRIRPSLDIESNLKSGIVRGGRSLGRNWFCCHNGFSPARFLRSCRMKGKPSKWVVHQLDLMPTLKWIANYRPALPIVTCTSMGRTQNFRFKPIRFSFMKRTSNTIWKSATDLGSRGP